MRKFLSTLMVILMMISAVIPVSAMETLSDDNGDFIYGVSAGDEDSLLWQDAQNATEEAVFDDEIWVGGIKVTAENKDDVFGDGGSVKYDPDTDTLTLTDATVSNESGHGIYSYGVNLTINGIDTDSEGSNDISGKCVTYSGIDEEGYEYTVTESGCGIFVEGNGYDENGSLVVNGVLGKIAAEKGAGITAYHDIVISGTVGDIYCTGGIDCGIDSCFGSVIVEESGALANITSEEYNGISAAENVIIKGKAGNINGGGYAGIHITGGDLIISGSVESVSGSVSGIEVYQDFDWDEDGNLVYTGGNAEISGSVGKILGDVVGIRTEADLRISGSAEITLTAMETEDKRALSVGGSIILPDGKDIIDLPEEYKIISVLAEAYEDENGLVEIWHNTISDSEGNPAFTVKFSGFINPFEDVSTSDWYYEDVEYAVVKGLMNGTSETEFAPNDKLTRAMLVTVLYRSEGEPAVWGGLPFEDVEEGSYYEFAVAWAKTNFIVSGISTTEFAPNQNITREQIAAIIHRYAQYKGFDTTQGGMAVREYDDYEAISSWSAEAMQWAVNTKLITGKTETTVNPLDSATRAEAAAILHRFIEEYVSE